MAAECRHKYSDNRAALANLNKAISLSPDFTSALIMRAEIDIDDADYDQALADATAAKRYVSDADGKDFVRASLVCAEACVKLRRWEEAYSNLLSVLKVRNDPYVLRQLAFVCSKMGNVEEANLFRSQADMLDADDDD